MNLQPLPELPVMMDPPLVEMQQRLISLRRSLEQACQDLDAQLAALGVPFSTAPTSVPAAPHLNASRSQASSPALTGPAACTQRLFEAAPSATQVLRQGSLPPEPQILQVTPVADLHPNLEQATLEELNQALSAAFAQIADKRLW